MAIDSPSKTGIVPTPTSTSPLVQRGANQDWRDWHKRGSKTPAEAISVDPRKNPVPITGKP